MAAEPHPVAVSQLAPAGLATMRSNSDFRVALTSWRSRRIGRPVAHADAHTRERFGSTIHTCDERTKLFQGTGAHTTKFSRLPRTLVRWPPPPRLKKCRISYDCAAESEL